MQTINLVPLQQHVERIGERIDAIVKGGPPPANSEASRAAADKLGVLAFHFAALNIQVSVDHLRATVALLQTIIPAFAHMSLIRPAHEYALVAEWLMEPRLSTDDRIARGVGIQVKDYADRRNFESDVRPRKRALPSDAKLTALLEAAHARNLARKDSTGAIIPLANCELPGAVDLFRMYEKTGRAGHGSWLYRYYSGFPHGRQWASLINAERGSAADANGNATGVVLANEDHIETLLGLTLAALNRAANAHASYHEAPAST